MSLINKPTQRGFTLLEILVTLVILAIGLLGLLSLQIVSLKNNHSAQQRTTAIVHAYDILDRIRVNKAVDYTINFGQIITGTALRDDDLEEWKDNLSNDLPEGDGAIVITGDIVTVSVRWNDARGTQGDGEQTFSVSTQR